jgi:chromosome segregation ATPase
MSDSDLTARTSNSGPRGRATCFAGWPRGRQSAIRLIGHMSSRRSSIVRASTPITKEEIARLRAQLAAAEALVKELRARLDELGGKLTDTQHELATARDQVEVANARAVAAGQAGRR